MEHTRVFVAASRDGIGSTVYHESLKCEAIKAAVRVQPRNLHEVAGKRRCANCWRSLAGVDLLAHDTERDGDSPFEVEFVRHVFAHVEGLNAHNVEPQKELHFSDGTKVRVDFHIRRPGREALVVELDGYDKTAGLVDPREIQRRDKAKRRKIEQDLALEVVDFSNIDLSDPHPIIRDLEQRVAVPSVMPSALAHASASLDQSGLPGRGRNILWVVAVLILALCLTGVVLWLNRDDEATTHPPLSDGSCPAAAPIKGNVAESGERIFHEEGWRYYDSTFAEECFAARDDAREAGYRESRVQ